MKGTIIIEKANGSVETREMHEYADLEKAKSEYVYIASAWDYAARVGNPIICYFREPKPCREEKTAERK